MYRLYGQCIIIDVGGKHTASTPWQRAGSSGVLDSGTAVPSHVRAGARSEKQPQDSLQLRLPGPAARSSVPDGDLERDLAFGSPVVLPAVIGKEFGRRDGFGENWGVTPRSGEIRRNGDEPSYTRCFEHHDEDLLKRSPREGVRRRRQGQQHHRGEEQAPHTQRLCHTRTQR